MAEISFLAVPGFRVRDEVLALMDPDNNPGGFEQCREILTMLRELLAQMPSTLKTEPYRMATGSSGGLYPIYVSETDPYVVYAAMQRESAPNEMLVLRVGMRGTSRNAVFYRELGPEVEHRIAMQGWLS
jgi:hypothetical protein